MVLGCRNGDYFVSLHMLMNFKHVIPLVLFCVLPGCVWAADFLTTSRFRFAEHRGGVSLTVEADFPTDGSGPAIAEARRWMGELLEVETEDAAAMDEGSLRAMLSASVAAWQQQGERFARRVELVLKYEDEDLFTFEATVVDKDSTTWRSEDCASFSKRDGHRIQASEVFACSEDEIKALMWAFRGNLATGVSSARQLVVGSVAFVDGWVVVIGPAEGYTGAAYRIRYQAAEPCLRRSTTGRYLATGAW